MQELLAEVLPWVLAFYLLDAVASVRRGQFVLSSPWGGAFVALRPGLRFLGWAPFAEAIPAIDLPWLAGREALWCFDPRRKLDLATIGEEDVTALSWATVAANASGKAVRAGSRTLLVAPHSAAAAHLAAALASLAACPPSEAAPEPAPSPGRTVLATIRERQRWSRLGLAATGTLLCVWTFLWAPLVAWGDVLVHTDFDGVGVLAALLAAELGLAVIHVRRAGATWGQALAGAASLAAWPVAALHPLLHLGVHPWSRCGGLEIAAAVLPSHAFRELAAVELARAEASAATARPPLANALSLRARRVAACAREAGLAEADLRHPPLRREGEGAWCPTCRTSFVGGTASCNDCGVPLRGFPAGQEPGGR